MWNNLPRIVRIILIPVRVCIFVCVVLIGTFAAFAGEEERKWGERLINKWVLSKM